MKESIQYTKMKAQRRARRVRAKIRGTAERPRLSAHFSGKHLSAQFIDDDAGKTVLAVTDALLGQKITHVKIADAEQLGKLTAERAREKGIKQIILDRGARAYHGRLAAFAQAARAGGLKF